MAADSIREKDLNRVLDRIRIFVIENPFGEVTVKIQNHCPVQYYETVNKKPSEL